MERYLLQPIKSVILQIILNTGQMDEENLAVTMNGMPIPVVEEVMHTGILRSADTQEIVVRENIQKARRTIYNLMGFGLHGHNDKDPLVFGLEVVLPKDTLIERLERIHKQFMKHILSLPSTVADPTVYILTGAIHPIFFSFDFMTF